MKRIIKKILVVIYAITFAFSLASTYDIASTSVVEAASPKLSKTKLSLGVGKSVTLKVKNTRKKVKWSSSNRLVAKVDDKGTVTGKTSGTVYIYAKVSGSTLLCKVTVYYSQNDAKKKISIKYAQTDVGNYTIAKVTNNNAYAVSIDAKMIFYNAFGSALGTRSDYCYCVGPKQTAVLMFLFPLDESDMSFIIPSSYKMSYNVEPSYYVSYSDKIRVSYDFGVEGVVSTIKNMSTRKLDTINLRCLMYDAAGKLIGANEAYGECYERGSTSYLTFLYPYDENFDEVIPASCEIYVNSAYAY